MPNVHVSSVTEVIMLTYEYDLRRTLKSLVLHCASLCRRCFPHRTYGCYTLENGDYAEAFDLHTAAPRVT